MLPGVVRTEALCGNLDLKVSGRFGRGPLRTAVAVRLLRPGLRKGLRAWHFPFGSRAPRITATTYRGPPLCSILARHGAPSHSPECDHCVTPVRDAKTPRSGRGRSSPCTGTASLTRPGWVPSRRFIKARRCVDGDDVVVDNSTQHMCGEARCRNVCKV